MGSREGQKEGYGVSKGKRKKSIGSFHMSLGKAESRNTHQFHHLLVEI